MEIWKILQYNGKYYPRYEISSFGRLRHADTKIVCRLYKTKYGYMDYYKPLEYGEKKRIHLRIHRAVMCSFVPNYNNLLDVNHIDGNKENNHLNNLEWVSHKDNMVHAIQTGLWKPYRKPRKLSNKDVLYVRENPNRYSNYRLAKMFGVDKKTMRDIVYGKTYKDVKPFSSSDDSPKNPA